MAIGQTNVKISDINTENTSTTSNSLKTLSETAVEGLSTLNEAPYAMSEFRGYTHGPLDHNVTITWSTPVGKVGFRPGLVGGAPSYPGASVPFGSQNLKSVSFSENVNVLRIDWSGNTAVNTGWISVRSNTAGAGTVTLNRTSFGSTTTSYVNQHYMSGLTLAQANAFVPTNNTGTATATWIFSYQP